MSRSSVFALMAALALVVPRPSAHQSDGGLVLRAVRFYRAEQKQTRVTVFVQIPYAFMEPTGKGAGGQLSYKVSVQVADSSGVRIAQPQIWRGHARGDLAEPGAYAIEILDFAVAPGRYKLDVEVEDSVSGHRAASGLEIQGFAEAPGASDLLLSPQMRLAAGDDSIPKPGEIRRGNTMVVAAARLRLTPLRSKAYYLLEAYGEQEQSGTMTVLIADSTGATVHQTKPAPVKILAGGSVLQGGLDLGGLPAGDYRMTVGLSLGGQKEERSAEFSMADLRTTLERDSAQRASFRVTDEGYFADMDEDQLKEAEAPLILIAKPGELSVWANDLPLSTKRQFLTKFWQQRDPNPATPRNEERERFYGAIDYANKTYSEGTKRAAVSGWRSDRGRVYARNGAPDDVLTRRNQGKAPPYEAWRYSRGKSRYYIFADRTGFGTYQLLATNDQKEAGLAGWQEVLGGDALQEVSRFLGVDFFDPNRNQ